MKILMIEDSKSDYFLVKTLIEEYSNENVDINWKIRLEDGISELNKDNYDLILLDLSLPDSFGINTFLKLQSLSKGIPIAVLTGNQDEDFAILAVRNGAIDYITKNNLNPAVLRRVLKYGLEQSSNFEALQKSKQAFQKYFDFSNDAAFIMDCNTGIVYDINYTMYNLLGYKKKPNIGKHYSKIFANTKLFLQDNFLETIKINGSIHTSVSFPKAKGGYLFVDVSASIVPWGMNKAILFIVRDAERRLELEKCLIEINVQLENLIKKSINHASNKEALEILKSSAFQKFQQAKEEIASFSEKERQTKYLRKAYIEEVKKCYGLIDVNYLEPMEENIDDISKKHLQSIFDLIDSLTKSMEVAYLVEQIHSDRAFSLKKDRIVLPKILHSIEQSIVNSPLSNRQVKIIYAGDDEILLHNGLVIRSLLSNLIDVISKISIDEQITVKNRIRDDFYEISILGEFSPTIFQFNNTKMINNSGSFRSISINLKLIDFIIKSINGNIKIQPYKNNKSQLSVLLPQNNT